MHDKSTEVNGQVFLEQESGVGAEQGQYINACLAHIIEGCDFALVSKIMRGAKRLGPKHPALCGKSLHRGGLQTPTCSRSAGCGFWSISYVGAGRLCRCWVLD